MQGSWFGDPNDPEEALAIAERFQGEWYNGGFSQFFANWEGADAALVPTALRVIGFPQGSEIVEKAISAMGPQDRWQGLGHQVTKDYKSPLATLLAGLDRDLSPLAETFDKAVVDFEYQRAKNFGEEMSE